MEDIVEVELALVVSVPVQIVVQYSSCDAVLVFIGSTLRSQRWLCCMVGAMKEVCMSSQGVTVLLLLTRSSTYFYVKWNRGGSEEG